jgi:hypothetical protein
MGFYGNITNTARTQFSFDKIYANRKAMEQSIALDGIYIGRFVLIEYDDDGFDGMLRVYIRRESNQNYFYTSSNYESNTLLTLGNTDEEQVVYTITTEGGKEKFTFYKRMK